MKRKTITMLGIISIVMGLAACGQVPANEGDSSSVEVQAESDITPEQSAPKVDEPALDWSAIEEAAEEDFVFVGTSVGSQLAGVKGVELKEYIGDGGVVKIPSTYDGRPVLVIGREAFSKTAVTDVYFESDGFVYIQSDAFRECTSLNSVVIRANEETDIRDKAFLDCTNLTSVVLSEEIINFWDRAFVNTPWLENKKKENPLVIVNNVVIDGTACSGEVVIPDGVVRIGQGAFRSNENITSVTIPDSVRRIEIWAFALCTSLENISFPDNLESMGSEYAYGGCKNIVITYKGKKYTYDDLKDMSELFITE